MEAASGMTYPRNLEQVFTDFKGRHAGLVKALTTDMKKFYEQCDPNKDNLCLYGLPNESWEVQLPAEEVPAEIPEPALGINFARDGMDRGDWLSLVAVHSDVWLCSVAFYFGARCGFDKEGRKKLFLMMNEMPTIYEIVTESVKKPHREKVSATPNSGSKNKSGTKTPRQSEVLTTGSLARKDEGESGEDEEEEEQGATLCGACGENYGDDDFWIGCDICEKWYHGKCVKITPARAEHIKQYKCPACSNKRARV